MKLQGWKKRPRVCGTGPPELGLLEAYAELLPEVGFRIVYCMRLREALELDLLVGLRHEVVLRASSFCWNKRGPNMEISMV